MCNQRHRWPAEGLWLKCAETCEAAGLDFGLCQSGPQGDQMGNLGEVRWRGHLPGCAQGVLPTIKDRVIIGGLPRWLSKGGRESACQCRRLRFDPWVGKILWGRAWQPTPVFLPGESHGHRSLAGYSPWGHKKSPHDLMTKQQHNNRKCSQKDGVGHDAAPLDWWRLENTVPGAKCRGVGMGTMPFGGCDPTKAVLSGSHSPLRLALISCGCCCWLDTPKQGAGSVQGGTPVWPLLPGLSSLPFLPWHLEWACFLIQKGPQALVQSIPKWQIIQSPSVTAPQITG